MEADLIKEISPSVSLLYPPLKFRRRSWSCNRDRKNSYNGCVSVTTALKVLFTRKKSKNSRIVWCCWYCKIMSFLAEEGLGVFEQQRRRSLTTSKRHEFLMLQWRLKSVSKAAADFTQWGLHLHVMCFVCRSIFQQIVFAFRASYKDVSYLRNSQLLLCPG